MFIFIIQYFFDYIYLLIISIIRIFKIFVLYKNILNSKFIQKFMYLIVKLKSF